MYWIYRNWRYVKERDNLTIRPFWRSMWSIFYCHSLLRRIHEDSDARSVLIPLFHPNILATGWVVLMLIARVIDHVPSVTASIVAICMPSFLCLAPVQSYVNSMTERMNPNQPYYRWSSGHIVCLIVGTIIWVPFFLSLGAK
jgi:hypothetical protein